MSSGQILPEHTLCAGLGAGTGDVGDWDIARPHPRGAHGTVKVNNLRLGSCRVSQQSCDGDARARGQPARRFVQHRRAWEGSPEEGARLDLRAAEK